MLVCEVLLFTKRAQSDTNAEIVNEQNLRSFTEEGVELSKTGINNIPV